MKEAFASVLTLLLFFPFALLIFKQIKTAMGLNYWARKLKRRDATQDEAEKVLTFLKTTWWIPNQPKYWGGCKTIYHSTVVSSQVNFQTKMAIFNRLDKLKCHGIVRPINKNNRQHA